jgi:hypothetical protein
MGVPELKNKILLQMDSADERILRIVTSVFENYFEGIENSDETINELLKVSEKEHEDGKTKSYESILNESKEKYFT